MKQKCICFSIKRLLLVILILGIEIIHAQVPTYPLDFREYHLNSNSTYSKFDVKEEVYKKVLNDRFTTLINGQIRNSIGNLASISPLEGSATAEGSFISKKGGVLSVNLKGAVTDGTVALFQNSKLNTNVALDFQYNVLFSKNKAVFNKDSVDVYTRQVNKLEYEYLRKQYELIYFGDDKKLAKLKADVEKNSSELKTDLQNEHSKDKNLLKIAELESRIKLNDHRLDSINKAVATYDQNTAMKSVHDQTLAQLERLSLQFALVGYRMGWFSFGYKVNRNAFKQFKLANSTSDQISEKSFVSHEARIQYSHFNLDPIYKRTRFWDIGIAFKYSDNFSSLKKIEVSETTEYGATAGSRSVTKKYNAYQGDYKQGLWAANPYLDFFHFFTQNNSVAAHISPDLLVAEGENGLVNLKVGMFLIFRDSKKENAVANVELFYRFLDIFRATASFARIFESNTIGIGLTFPITFKFNS